LSGLWHCGSAVGGPPSLTLLCLPKVWILAITSPVASQKSPIVSNLSGVVRGMPQNLIRLRAISPPRERFPVVCAKTLSQRSRTFRPLTPWRRSVQWEPPSYIRLYRNQAARYRGVGPDFTPNTPSRPRLTRLTNQGRKKKFGCAILTPSSSPEYVGSLKEYGHC
jgi:hypothetical protein